MCEKFQLLLFLPRPKIAAECYSVRHFWLLVKLKCFGHKVCTPPHYSTLLAIFVLLQMAKVCALNNWQGKQKWQRESGQSPGS